MNLREFRARPLLGILRHITEKELVPVFEVSIEAGLRHLEIALNTKNAFRLIGRARKLFGKEAVIGAGTVLSPEEARSAFLAGATFLVSPSFSAEIASYCAKNGVPYFPGALTPSEIYTAWSHGAAMVKVFPASLFGPEYFKEIKAPFSSVKLMAVGGVTPENMADYFRCGASAVAFGGSVFQRGWIESKNWKAIGSLIRKYVALQKRSVCS